MPMLAIMHNPPRRFSRVTILSREVVALYWGFAGGQAPNAVYRFDQGTAFPSLDLLKSGGLLLRWTQRGQYHFAEKLRVAFAQRPGRYMTPDRIQYRHAATGLLYEHAFSSGTIASLVQNDPRDRPSQLVIYRLDGEPLFRFFKHAK